MYDEDPITIRVEGDTPPSLMELQRMVKGYIEVIEKGNKQFICNEEGRLLNLPYNQEASEEAREHLVGNVVILTNNNRIK